MSRPPFALRLGRSIDLILLLVLLLPATALALPATSTISGTMVTSSGAACGGCKLTIRTPFTQNVDGGSFPAGEQRTWTMEADGDLPSGVTSTQGLWVEITMQKADPFTVQIPLSSSTTLQALIALGSSPPAGGTSADITAVWSCSSGDCSNLTAASGDVLNAEGADSTAPCKSGTSVPASCQVADCFFDTDATAGENLNVCTATNTWSQISGGGGGSGDIEAVWSTTSGTVDALTAASGDSFNAGSADSSIPVTKSTSLPGTCTEGQLHQDTNSGGLETYICTATNTWQKLTTQFVYDVRDYGALCNDSTNDTAAIQAAIDAAEASRGGVVMLPAERCIVTALTIDAPGITLKGQGAGVSNKPTVLSCNITTGTCVTLGSGCTSGCGVEDLIISTRNAPTDALLIDGTDAAADFVRDVNFVSSRYCTGLKNIASAQRISMFEPIAGVSCRAISIVDNGAFMNDIKGNWTTDIEGMIVIEQTSTNVVDTVQASQLEIATSGGKGAALKIMGNGATNPPRWVRISDSFFEAKTTSSGAGDYPIHISNVRDFECSNCYAQGGYRGVVVEGGPGPVVFLGGSIGNTQREAVYHDADAITSLIGTTVSDASLETDNTYSDVYLTANSRGFSMIGGTVGAELLGFPGNDPKYGIEVISGADEYRFSDVVCSDVPDSGCAAGLTPAAAQVAFTDAVALADSDWSTYGVLKATGTLSGNRTWTLPDETGTVCTTGSVCTGYQAGPLSGDVVTSGAAATIQANSVALGTDTTGNYALGDAEGGAATSGDSATSFFGSGTIEAARLPDADDDASTKGILTLPNAQFDCTSGSCSIASGGIGSTELADTFSATTITANLTGNVTGNADTATTAGAGDSATAFFSSGTIEAARLPDADDDASTKGIITLPDSQFDCTTGSCSIATGGIGSTELADTFSATTITASLTGAASLNTLLAGRAGTGNDTILSTDGTGTLYGSGATANDLTLRANDDNTTTGEINLNAPVVELYPSYPASSTVTAALLKATPTFTSSGDAAQWTMINSAPVMTVADTSANADFRAGGSLARTGTSEATLYADSGFYMNRAYTSATTAGPLFPDAFYANWTATQTGSATANSSSYIPISFLDKSQIRANDSATWTLDNWWQFAAYGSINDQTSGALTVTNRHAFHVTDVTMTNTPTLTNNVGFYCESLAAGTNDICYESVGTDDEFRHAGRGRFGATGAPTAGFDLDVEGAAKVADYLDAGDDIADLSSNTVNLVDLAPTVDISGSGVLRGVQLTPTSAISGDLATLTALGMAGTITQTGSPTFGTVAKIMNHTTVYTSATATATPAFQVYGVSDAPTVSSSASSGSVTVSAVAGMVHAPTISRTGAGTMTVTEHTGFTAAGTYTESAGTLAVTTRTGFKANDITNTSSATAITTNIGVDIAAFSAGTTNIGLRNADTTVYTPTTDNISSATDYMVASASALMLTAGSALNFTNGTDQIANGQDGQILYLFFTGSNSITFDDGDNLNLAAASRALSAGDTLVLMYSSTGGEWMELSFANN